MKVLYHNWQKWIANRIIRHVQQAVQNGKKGKDEKDKI